MFFIFGFAPLSSKGPIKEIASFLIAKCNGDIPSLLHIFGSAPLSNNSIIASKFSLSIAWYKGVSFILFVILGSAPNFKSSVIAEMLFDISARYKGVHPYSFGTFISSFVSQNKWIGLLSGKTSEVLFEIALELFRKDMSLN